MKEKLSVHPGPIRSGNSCFSPTFPVKASLIFFWILWAIAALVGLVVRHFFFVGLADGSLSAANSGLFLLLLMGSNQRWNLPTSRKF